MAENNETVVYDDITPYFASMVASKVLGRKITSNQFYGYAARNIISNYKNPNDRNKVYFDGNAFKVWLDAEAKSPRKGGKVDITALTALYTK